MSITFNDVTLRNTIGDSIISRLAAGTANATARLVFRTSANVVLATANCTAPPTGSFDEGTVTFSAIADAPIVATGVVTNFQAINRDAVVIFSGSVTPIGGSGNITFNLVSWVDGDLIRLNSLTLTIPGA
jgi:hypothetical protein